MLALKSAAAALLAVLTLVVVTPALLHQDAGPGKPDDVAQVLPENTLAFVELVKAPRLLNDWKEYVGSVTTADGKDKVCAFVEEWFTKAIEIIPEKILKDLKAGLPSIQRMAVALTGTADHEVPWMFIATSTDPAFFKKLVEEDLSVFAAEEKSHLGVKVFAIRKLGELKADSPVFVAASGPRLFITTRWASLTDALDRAAGRGAGGDLRKNALYAQLAPAASEDPVLRGFTRWDWDSFTTPSQGSGYSPRRMGRFHLDQGDAVFGIRKLRGSIVEATFKPGKVVSTMRIPVESPCRVYDAFRQPAGPKDLLAHLPKKTVGFSHLNLKGGKEVWEEVENFMRRFQAVERQASERRGGEDYIADMDRQSRKELGFAPRELAAVIGNEIVFAMAPPSEDAGVGMFLGLARATDPAKVKALMETVAETSGKLTAVKEEKFTYWKYPEANRVCFGLRDSVIAIGFNEEVVKEALSTTDDAAGWSKRLAKEASTASGVMVFSPVSLIEIILGATGTPVPEMMEHFRRDDWSVVTLRTEKDHAALISTDSGAGALLQGAASVMPGFMFLAFRGFGPMGRHGHVEEAAAGTAPEPPALPADVLKKKAEELVPLLRSDDLPVREDAMNSLRALGRQVAPHLVAAFKVEKDAEARSRLTTLLVDFKAWDVLPELLDRKVDAFFNEFQSAIDSKKEDEYWGGYASWHNLEEPEPWSIEPYLQPEFLARMKNADVLGVPGGLKRFAERLRKTDVPAPKRAQYAAVLAFNDCGPASETVLEMRDIATDAESRAYFTMALGWSDEAKAKEALYKSMASEEIAVRRGAFMGAERLRDPGVVPRLLERTKDKTFESRWNAGYTLGVVTGGKLELNAFLPEAEFLKQIQTATEWWEKNKATFKPSR